MEPQKRKILHCVVSGKDLFADWFYSLADSAVRDVVIRRLMRVSDGNFGDHAPVGGGVWELRIHFGAGHRVYYGEQGAAIVILICGGDKHSQKNDIRRATKLWALYRGKI